MISTNSFGLPYTYPDTFEEHMLYVPKKAEPPVLDEKYPYINKKIPFKIARAVIITVSQTIGFMIIKLVIGLKAENRKVLKKHKEALKNGAISICNHVHMWDFLCVMFALRHKSFYFPAWPKNLTGPNRHLIRLVGGVPIPSQRHAILKFHNTLNEVLDNGKWLHFYPETSAWFYYEAIRPFKKGVFSYAVKHNKPIIPLVIKYRDPKKCLNGSIEKNHYYLFLWANPFSPILPCLKMRQSSKSCMKPANGCKKQPDSPQLLIKTSKKEANVVEKVNSR